jgi:hypothetical protein
VGFLVEYSDELVADDFTFPFRIGHSRKLAEEALGGIHRVNVQAELFAQVLLDLFEFVFAQDAIVDED